MRVRSAAWLLLAALAAPARADEPKVEPPGPWRFGAIAAVNLSQSAFSSNWSGGDRGSIVWVANTDVTARRQFTTTYNLSNTVKLAYGQTSEQVEAEDGDLVWDAPDKTTDLVNVESLSRWTLGAVVDPYASLRLDSQFLDRSNPAGDLIFNPVTLKESAGIARVLKKTEDSEALTRLGFGLRQTFARSFDAGGEEVSYTTNDGGLEWQTDVTQPVLEKKVVWKGQILLFWPLFYSQSEDLEAFDRLALTAYPGRESVAGFWKAPDINAQSTFSAAITKAVSVNLFLQLVYDKFDSRANVDPSQPLAEQVAEIDRNIRKKGQFKETLAIGISYTLF